jgi:hypothetical protein
MNLYDLASLTEKANIDLRSNFDAFLKVSNLKDSFFDY